MIPTGQEDPGNNPKIQIGGCSLFSHWWNAERVDGSLNFDTPETINAEYQKLLDNGIKDIRPDCFIEDGVALFATYGINVRQVLDPVTGSAWISPNYVPKPGQLCIKCFHWDLKGYIHFCGWDPVAGELYDPIARGSNTVKNGYFHSWRIYELV